MKATAKIKTGQFGFAILFFLLAISLKLNGQVNTGGTAQTNDHTKEVIGYITNWDAWKQSSAGVPVQGALTHLNIDYSKYTILNYSFFGVAVDGSLHSGDHRNKQIYQAGAIQNPDDIFHTILTDSWDLHLLFGEMETVYYINESIKQRAEAQGFQVEVGGSSWTNSNWGLSGALPLPLHTEGGAPGLLELAHANGVKVMASIGGWSMCKHFPEMAADPVKRAKFIQDCQKLINIGFDGIDLDWEYPGPFAGMNFTGSQVDFANFLTLITELRSVIGSNKLITSAMSASPSKLQGFDWTQLANVMDYFNMMTYDMNGGWSNVAGHNAPVYSYSGAEEPEFNWESTRQALVSNGVPSNQINFGIPFYGRGVITNGAADLNAPTLKRAETVQPDGPITTCSDFTNWPRDVYDGTPNHFFIQQQTGPGSGWVKHWDDEAKVPYMTKDNFFLSYDDEQSVGIKAQYIKDNNLAGTIIWTVYGDLEMSGTVTSFGTKLKRWSDVNSPLINKINSVFADGVVDPGNTPPTVSITSPTPGTLINAGDIVTLSASANDIDGSISSVEFSIGGQTIPASLTGSTYTATWNASGNGSVNISAVAIDNENGTASDQISVIINDSNEPGCASLAWVANEIYNRGDKVSYQDAEYEAAHWTQNQNPADHNSQWGPWIYIGPCSSTSNDPPSVAITSPSDGAAFIENTIVSITASASDSDGSISVVEFFVDGTKFAEDTTDPFSSDWTATSGNHLITAKATDNAREEAISGAISIQVNSDQGDLPPNVDISSPISGTSFTVGDEVVIEATASDDGSVSKVEFIIDGSLIGEDTSEPYSISWVSLEGNHLLVARAIDNDNLTSNSEGVNITVYGIGGGCDVPDYVENGGYSGGTQVQNDGNLYECKPYPYEGWCNGGAWAYEPGNGLYWEDAWILVGECDGGSGNESPSISLTGPANNSTYDVGDIVNISANASDTDGSVSQVQFLIDGAVINTDTSSPYSANWVATQGNHTITAVATDDLAATTTSSALSISVGNIVIPPSDLPDRLLVGYWHNFINGAGGMKLSEVSSDWDVINVSFAIPSVPTGANMVFTPDNAIYSSIQEFKNDVSALQSQGKKVLISIGGATGAMHLNTAQDGQTFGSTMINIIEEYGFDGMDIDLEGSSLSLTGDTDFRSPISPKIVNFISGTQNILNHFGPNFILTAAPETLFVQGGFSGYGGSTGAYLPVIYAFRNDLDYIHVQHYNTGCMLGLDGQCYSQGTADFQVAMAEMLLQGFPVPGNPVPFPALRSDQVAIGLPATQSAAGGGYTNPATVQQALDYLIKGVSYGGNYSLVNPAGYSDFRGLMTWSINWDRAAGFEYSGNHRPYLDALGPASARTADEIIENEEFSTSSEVMVFPNPFQDNLSVLLDLNEASSVSISVLDLGGKLVSNIEKNQYYERGKHNISWSNQLKTGLYIIQISIGENIKTLKLYKN